MDFKDLLERSRGYDTFAEKEKEIEERQKSFVSRFWLPGEANAKIVFLDDNPPIIEEHQLKLNNDWRNWYTCLRIVGETCPICDELDDKPYTVGFYTIIDTTEWTDKKGETHKNQLKLFAAKFQTLQILKRLSGKRGSLAGCVFDVYRSSKDAANTGDVFDFEGKLDKEDILKLIPEASIFDYSEILAPKKAGDILRDLRKNSERSYTAFTDDNDVVF
ncbi:MAG: hypothetical protein GX957_16355 [Clostridiaceae bacterium]|nr:hypothetical protein [Clostridiaceae bacterium]